MNLRKTGKHGEIWLPNGDGVQLSNVELALVASKAIGGITYANLFLAHAQTHWNKSKGMSVTLQGIIGEAGIEPATGNDAVQTPAIDYYKDDTSGKQTAAADTSVTVTRPAAAKFAWNLIVLDMDDGLVSAVKGTDGDAFVDTFGAAGGPPFVASDKLIIGGVRLDSDTAAPVDPSEITLFDSTGKLLQERSDIPGFEIVPLEGGVLLYETLLGSRTGNVSRKAYASFYSQKSVLLKKGHSTKWSYDISRSSVAMPAQGDVAPQKDLSGSAEWSGSASFYAVDDSLRKLAAEKGTGFVRLFRDRNTAEYVEGAIIITGYSESCDQANAITGDLTFEGDGALEFRS